MVHCVEEAIPAVIGELLDDGPQPSERTDRWDVLAGIAREAARLTVATGKKGRIVRRTELKRFRAFGEQCAGAGVRPDEMVSALDGAGDMILDTMIACARLCDGLWKPREIDQVIEALCGCIETLTRYAYDELVAGYFPEGCGPARLAA